MKVLILFYISFFVNAVLLIFGDNDSYILHYLKIFSLGSIILCIISLHLYNRIRDRK